MSQAAGREAILARIRSARQSTDAGTTSAEIPRSYERCGTLSPAARLVLFEERLHEYGADTIRVTPSSLPAELASMIEQAAITRIAVPPALPSSWLTANVTWLVDHNLPASEIETAHAVLTGASIAVASTGTIVLQHGAHEGRRVLTLLPDHHFCVIREEQLVETLPEAMGYLGQNPLLPTTLISGPSATADIEMTRIKGVHGPRFLHVLLVQSEAADSV